MLCTSDSTRHDLLASLQSSNLQVALSAASSALANGSDPTMAAAAAQAAVQAVVATQQQPNSVLRVIVENMLYPVSLDVLYQVS